MGLQDEIHIATGGRVDLKFQEGLNFANARRGSAFSALHDALQGQFSNVPA
jgi:hypothetical protein